MNEDFYVVAQESGFGPEPLPTWTDYPGKVNPFEADSSLLVTRKDISEVPGAFQLLNVLTATEADNVIDIAERLGFHQDAPVSLPREIRHNDNLNWIVSTSINEVIWGRSRSLVTDLQNGEVAKGLNARYRFYRYSTGDFFQPHTDGAWPGSEVIDQRLVVDAHPGLYSQYTYLLFLNDGYQGGHTQFFVSKSNPGEPAKAESDVNLVNVRTPKGAALCFPHGMHPLHCLHASEEIFSGTKYVIRTDVLFGT